MYVLAVAVVMIVHQLPGFTFHMTNDNMCIFNTSHSQILS